MVLAVFVGLFGLAGFLPLAFLRLHPGLEPFGDGRFVFRHEPLLERPQNSGNIRRALVISVIQKVLNGTFGRVHDSACGFLRLFLKLGFRCLQGLMGAIIPFFAYRRLAWLVPFHRPIAHCCLGAETEPVEGVRVGLAHQGLPGGGQRFRKPVRIAGEVESEFAIGGNDQKDDGVGLAGIVWRGFSFVVVAVMRRHHFHAQAVFRGLGQSVPEGKRAGPVILLVVIAFQAKQRGDGLVRPAIALSPSPSPACERGDLAMIAEHSGVYLGGGKIAHLDGSDRVEIVMTKTFLKRLGGWNPAMSIYVSSDEDGAVGSEAIALRARAAVGRSRDYNLLLDNCHQFVSGCISGEFENADNFLWMLKDTAQKTINATAWREWDLPEDA